MKSESIFPEWRLNALQKERAKKVPGTLVRRWSDVFWGDLSLPSLDCTAEENALKTKLIEMEWMEWDNPEWGWFVAEDIFSLVRYAFRKRRKGRKQGDGHAQPK